MSIKKNKLNEAARNTGDFLSNYLGSSISQKPIEQPSQANTSKSAPMITESTEQASIAPQTIPQPPKKKPKKETHKTYTFWVNKNKLAEWKAYVATKGIKSEDLGLYAIQHWIDQVAPITPEEQEYYHRNLEHELADIDKDARLKKK